MRWRLLTEPTTDWPRLIRVLGGGFFHSPAGAALWGSGTAVFGTLVDNDGCCVGILAGRRSRCRGGRGHLYFPSLPALAPGVPATEAFEALRRELVGGLDAEAVLDSYDAGFAIPGVDATRLEYVVSLSDPVEGLLEGFGSTHRRNVRRGERDGFELRTLRGSAGAQALSRVQEAASHRASRKGRGFDPDLPEDLREGSGAFAEPWGTTVFGALDAGGELLAAVLVGWGGARAFYIAGGSTPSGYRTGAATWLHWRVMTGAASAGIQTYNLGGSPVSAARGEDPSHGLYRFKRSFGATVVERRGVRMILRPMHVALHGLARHAFRN